MIADEVAHGVSQEGNAVCPRAPPPGRGRLLRYARKDTNKKEVCGANFKGNAVSPRSLDYARDDIP